MSDETTTTRAPVPRISGRPRGRPRLARPSPPAAAERPPVRPMMRARPNWEGMTPSEDSADKLHIPRSMFPDGMDFQWVTDSVRGQGMSQHRATFEKRGWTPVHQADFEGRFDGMFMQRGADGEITHEGLVLMARPFAISQEAGLRDVTKARTQVQIKERAVTGGDMPGVSLDSRHPSAVGSNRIGKSVERIHVPEE